MLPAGSDVLGCAPVVCIFSYIYITGARMLIRGCHAPVPSTPGDGRSASQGTDLPRAVGEKRRQRHFGILWRSAQFRQLDCVSFVFMTLQSKKPSPKGRPDGSFNCFSRRGIWHIWQRHRSWFWCRPGRSRWLPRRRGTRRIRRIPRRASDRLPWKACPHNRNPG